MTLPRSAAAAVVVALAGAVVGCGSNDRIDSYSVPTPAKIDAPLPERAGDFRILGAVFPIDDERAWYFKFGGPAAELAKHEAAFDALLASVRFPNGVGEAPTFTAPPGWTQEGRQELGGIVIDATLRPNPADPTLRVTLSSSGGGLERNLDRWAVMQLGGSPVRRAEFPRITRDLAAGDVKGHRVDLRGPNDPNARKMPGRK